MDKLTKQLAAAMRDALLDIRTISADPLHPNRQELADYAAEALETALATYDAAQLAARMDAAASSPASTPARASPRRNWRP